MTNVFLSLGKYKAGEENYYTECLALLLKILLERERPIGIEFLNWLCNSDFQDDEIYIETQKEAEEGRPDMIISSQSKRFYVEVKVNSPVDWDQIDKYAKYAPVVLITKEFVEEKKEKVRHVRWQDIYNFLKEKKPAEPVSSFFLNQFVEFIGGEMDLERVKITEEYIEVMRRFYKWRERILKFMRDVIEKLGFKQLRSTFGRDWCNFYFSPYNLDLALFVDYSEPDKLFFQYNFLYELKDESKKREINEKIDKILEEFPNYKKYLREEKHGYAYYLPLDEEFFSLPDAERQFEEVKKFTHTCVEALKKVLGIN